MEGKVLDNVHPAIALDRVEQCVHRRFDAAPHPLDDARGKRLVDQASQPRMVGRVGVEQSDGEVLLEGLKAGSVRLGQGV